jgi:hypothetical protein
VATPSSAVVSALARVCAVRPAVRAVLRAVDRVDRALRRVAWAPLRAWLRWRVAAARLALARRWAGVRLCDAPRERLEVR